MTEVQRIADQLHRAFHGEAWHGPSVMEALDGVSAKQAASKPINGAHSIWEIALHISAWADAGSRRLQGETVELSDEEDWPAISATSETAWQQTVADLKRRQAELEKVVAGFDGTRLDEVSPGRETSFYFLMHGLIQHSLYHAGQIALLKKKV